MAVAEQLVKQRRFRMLFVGLVMLALLIAVVIVPVESRSIKAMIKTPFDGLWWAVTTMTGVGYGDFVPVTNEGKILGMLLQLAGVLSFGLLVSMVTVTLEDYKEHYYRYRLEESVSRIEEKLERLEKKQNYLVRTQEEHQ